MPIRIITAIVIPTAIPVVLSDVGGFVESGTGFAGNSADVKLKNEDDIDVNNVDVVDVGFCVEVVSDVVVLEEITVTPTVVVAIVNWEKLDVVLEVTIEITFKAVKFEPAENKMVV